MLKVEIETTAYLYPAKTLSAALLISWSAIKRGRSVAFSVAQEGKVRAGL